MKSYIHECSKKVRKNLVIRYLMVFIIALGVGVLFKNTNGKADNGYSVGEQGSLPIIGYTPGDADIWPVEKPLYIVKLFDSKKGMGTSNNAYTTQLNKIKDVIPASDSDSIWLLPNDLSKYLINKGFHTEKQMYLAIKPSDTNTELKLVGNSKSIMEQIKFLSKNETTAATNIIKKGIYYDKLLKLYQEEQDINLLAKSKKFNEFLKNELNEAASLSLWSYITNYTPGGNNSIQDKIDEYLHVNNELNDLDLNKWEDTQSKIESGTLTVGESFNLRYLDLLVTLYTIAPNKDYWKAGIVSYMTKNAGFANISITIGITARTESISVKGGKVKPATILVSCNDLLQTKNNINAKNNLSVLSTSKTVTDNANSTDYLKRLKTAVKGSAINSVKSGSIYSSAISSRVIEERIKTVSKGNANWVPTYNELKLIRFLYFKVQGKTYEGASWVMEPPLASKMKALNYAATISVSSRVNNTNNNEADPKFVKKPFTVNLVKYYENDEDMKYNKKVPTADNIKLQIKIYSLNEKGNKTDTAEWQKFVDLYKVKGFRIRVDLFEARKGINFKSQSQGGRNFQLVDSAKNNWINGKWMEVPSSQLLTLLEGEEPLSTFVDDEIIKEMVEKNITSKYKARVTIQYKNKDSEWKYITDKEDSDTNVTEGTSPTETYERRITNELDVKHSWKSQTRPPEYDYPYDNWTSEEAPNTFAELKEGSIYNETFEAMAGVPSTRTLYFSSGGNEFLVDLRVSYDADNTAIREYICHYNGIECEYKENDQLKGGTGNYKHSLKFVGSDNGNTIAGGQSVQAEEGKIAEASGNSSGNFTISDHNSSSTIWAEWTGTISNQTPEPKDDGKFDPGKPGSTCAGLGFDVGKQRGKQTPVTSWEVSAYHMAVDQALDWAKKMEQTNSSFTVEKIADSDGQKRQYLIGDAKIVITFTGGDNSYQNTQLKGFSSGTFTTSDVSSQKFATNDASKYGSGWGWTKGEFGKGSGYVAGAHGHGGTCPGDDKLITPSSKDSNGNTIPAVYGPCGIEHKCGSFTAGTDITQGPSSAISYTITVTFQNGKLKSSNDNGSDGNITRSETGGLTYLPDHALCGGCCSHDLPAIQDTWTQKLAYDTIKITRANVYKIHKGIGTEMEEITYESNPNVIAGVTQGDPNIFYNIIAQNNPIYKDGELMNASQVGRIRYSLQEQQGDKVYYEEFTNNKEERTNKCDGMTQVVSSSNPASLSKKGHELSYASGILYSNGKTKDINLPVEDFISDNKATIASKKQAYSSKLDERDLKTAEWERFYKRRMQEVTATVISDMLILQTSSGDQSPTYFDETTKAKAQEDYPILTIDKTKNEKDAVQAYINAKWKKMWVNNQTTFAKAKYDSINIGSYNGKYNNTTQKYTGSGNKAEIKTRFDQDRNVFSTAIDELGLANVSRKYTFSHVAYGKGYLSSPGKLQARMDRQKDLRIVVDKIKQKPTNSNQEYETGESFVYYLPILNYKEVGGRQNPNAEPVPADELAVVNLFEESTNEVLKMKGLTYNSRYTESEYASDKVNNIIVHDPVSAQHAMVLESGVEDQRTMEAIATDAMEHFLALERCPDTPALCEYRKLSCKFQLDTTSVSFAFEDEIVDKNVRFKQVDGYYYEQLITNSLVNADGVQPTFELPVNMDVVISDGTFLGFGTNQFLKVTGQGTKLQIPYNDCKVFRTSSSRIKVVADIYVANVVSYDRMLFSIGGVGAYVPANSSRISLINTNGYKREGTIQNVVGRNFKLSVTFSLGSIFDSEVFIDGLSSIPRITTGLTDSQISSGLVTDDMVGSGLNIGSWEGSPYYTNFYVDNITIIRCGGELSHSSSCYTVTKEEDMYYQEIYNGIASGYDTIDWVRKNDTINNVEEHYSKYSKHIHSDDCILQTSKGYQIAIAEAKVGNWTSMEKMVGPQLYKLLVEKYKIVDGRVTVGGYKKGQVLSYQYNGGQQEIYLPKGTYELEAYGAQGGNDTQVGGKGGYSTGTLELAFGKTLYLNAGGKGANNATGNGGGYNGGGNAGPQGSSGGGGGATSISLKGGTLQELLNNGSANQVLLVAGGGGGAGNDLIIGTTAELKVESGNTYFSTREGVKVYEFQAIEDGTLTFSSNSYTADPYGHIYLYNSNNVHENTLSNDDGGGNLNFSLSTSFTKGQILRFYVGAYSSSGSASWTINYRYNETQKTLLVGQGGTGGGVNGGHGGIVYEAGYSGLGGNASKYYSLGSGESQISDGPGAGGGYYGGFVSQNKDVGAGGGSGYISSSIRDGRMENGIQEGNGKITIKIVDIYNFPDETELYNFIKQHQHLIPDKVTTYDITITNPIWNCKVKNNTGVTFTEYVMLSCTEPHHEGSHYDYTNDICWAACGDDSKHKVTHQEVKDPNGNRNIQAAHITLDNFFKLYYPNTGDFYGNGSHGLQQPVVHRGKGYESNMDTTEWTREKYVKFDYDVLYERNGKWESYVAGSWIPLEIIDPSTTRNLSLSGGTTLQYEGKRYDFDFTLGLMTCEGRSTTLIEGNTMAVYNGNIFVVNPNKTISVSKPYSYYNFYCLLTNNEKSYAEIQCTVEAINYGEDNEIHEPYRSDYTFTEEYDVYWYGNTYSNNKKRDTDFTAYHTAVKIAYIDVVGRIGNFIIEDSDDMRFSNFFKTPLNNSDSWYIEGVISEVDNSLSRYYLSWHRNSLGYPLALDVRGEQVAGDTAYYNTWRTQSWTESATSKSLGVSGDKNSNSILHREQLKLGYNVLFDVTTMGNYDHYLQVLPYFYALDKSTSEMIPVDVYINDDGSTKPINYFGLYSEYMDPNGNYLPMYYELIKNLYVYNMYLNWSTEAVRRNYIAGSMEEKITEIVRNSFMEDISDSDGDVLDLKPITVPFGANYNLGSLQCLQPGRRARTFVGNSKVSSIINQSLRLGITNNGINGGIETNISGNYLPQLFYKQAQRWHLTLGLPSSAKFTAYRERGIHLTPEDDVYRLSYVEGGVSKTKVMSRKYMDMYVGLTSFGNGTVFNHQGVTYTIEEKFNAGDEFNVNDNYVIIMTADIKAIGESWNLKYSTGNDNGNITIDGKTFHFGGDIPTFIAAYDTISSSEDAAIEQTH